MNNCNYNYIDNAKSRVMEVLDPKSGFVIKWKRLMLIVGLLSVFIDPLFLYVPSGKGVSCVSNDVPVAIFFTVSRTLLDFIHLVDIIFKFRIAIEGPGPRVFNRRNLIKDPYLIALNYLKSFFIVDLISILPLPQIIIWTGPSTRYSEVLSMSVLLQFTPRMMTMMPLNTKIINAFGITLKRVWSGAIYNLSIFILIGHLLGAIYYQSYHAALELCLYDVFGEMVKNVTHPVELDCSQLHKECSMRHKELDHGMLSDAFANEIALRGSIQKLIYCFVWGVRSLSSLGQIFDASYDLAETFISCLIMVTGLILLADLIARMQTSVQSVGARRDWQRVKQRKLEEWTHYYELPADLKGRVKLSAQSEWQETKGIDDEAILNSLPSDLRRDLRNHLYKERARCITPFSRMEDQLLDFVCGHLRTFLGAEGTYIVLQGDPVEQMVFIFNGFLQLSHHSGGRSSSRSLEPGDFFGEELITWAAQPNLANQNPLPTSTYTVKCLSNVEAFCLPAEDVRLLHIFNFSLSFQKALRAHQS